MMNDIKVNKLLQLFFLLTFFIMTNASILRAQGELYDGPFGLFFGQSADDVEYDYLYDIDLRSVSFNQSCARQVLSSISNNNNLRDFYSYPSLEFTVQTDLSRNALRADFSDRLFASMYNIPVQGGFSEMCLAFFDDRLFMIYMNQSEYRRYRDILTASLNNRYGQGRTFGNGSVYITNWQTRDEALFVQLVTSLVGSLTYVYNPIRREQIPYIFETYIEYYRAIGENGDF